MGDDAEPRSGQPLRFLSCVCGNFSTEPGVLFDGVRVVHVVEVDAPQLRRLKVHIIQGAHAVLD